MGSPGNRPRLAYAADVGVERTLAGSLLLYRLLGDYPPERLLVIEGGHVASQPALRLPLVRCEQLSYYPRRLGHSRFARLTNLALVPLVRWWAGALERRFRRFRAEAVLTVAHGHLWLAAAVAARRMRLPLHLILHDDWPSVLAPTGLLQGVLRSLLRRVYRQAASRLCVSPYMAEEYQQTFGVPGTTLYPSRGEDSPEPRVRYVFRPGQPPVVAYAGSLWNEGFLDLVRRLAVLVAARGGRLDLYTNTPPEVLVSRGLAGPHIGYCGFQPPRQMAEQMAATASLLFNPASYLPAEVRPMRLLFSSKLADYTAVGLPILIWGPSYCSAVRWAEANTGVAAVVTDREGRGLDEVLDRLMTDEVWGRQSARRGVEVGCRDFSLDTARAALHAALRAASV